MASKVIATDVNSYVDICLAALSYLKISTYSVSSFKTFNVVCVWGFNETPLYKHIACSKLNKLVCIF